MCGLKQSSHLPGHRSPAKPSLGLSGRQLPGPLGTLLKKGFPHFRLPLEQPPQLEGDLWRQMKRKQRREQKD